MPSAPNPARHAVLPRSLYYLSSPPRPSFLQVGVLPAAQRLAQAALHTDLPNDGKWEGRNNQELLGGGIIKNNGNAKEIDLVDLSRLKKGEKKGFLKSPAG